VNPDNSYETEACGGTCLPVNQWSPVYR